MAKLSTYALAGALAFALAPVAGYAADLPEPPLLEPTAPVEFGSSWYLRGDVGYKIYRKPDVRYKAYGSFKGEDLNDTGVIGGGVGYKFNSWFRADATLDYEFKSKFKGSLICPTAPCEGHPRAPLYSSESAKISALTGLLNGYIDLGEWQGVTPYIGAGVGASRLHVSNYDYVNPLPYGKGTKGSHSNDSNWSFSWALMAGLGYQVTENLVIDAGYRFLNLGDAKTSVKVGPKGKVDFKDIQAHEFRVGFRYLIN